MNACRDRPPGGVQNALNFNHIFNRVVLIMYIVLNTLRSVLNSHINTFQRRNKGESILATEC
jgi:hypothetical protein